MWGRRVVGRGPRGDGPGGSASHPDRAGLRRRDPGPERGCPVDPAGSAGRPRCADRPSCGAGQRDPHRADGGDGAAPTRSRPKRLAVVGVDAEGDADALAREGSHYGSGRCSSRRSCRARPGWPRTSPGTRSARGASNRPRSRRRPCSSTAPGMRSGRATAGGGRLISRTRASRWNLGGPSRRRLVVAARVVVPAGGSAGPGLTSNP